MQRYWERISLILVLIFGLCAVSFAQTQKDKPKKEVPLVTKTTKEIQGEVSYINKNFISVIYKRQGTTEYEMMFPLDNKIKLVHKQSLGQIVAGDTVSVEYDETLTATKDAKGVERKAKVIYFVRSGSRKPEVIEQ